MVADLPKLVPPPLHRLLVRAVYGPKWFSMIVTAMPGPRQQQHMGGQPVRGVGGILPLPPGVALTIGALRWTHTLTVTVLADPAALPDLSRSRRAEALDRSRLRPTTPRGRATSMTARQPDGPVDGRSVRVDGGRRLVAPAALCFVAGAISLIVTWYEMSGLALIAEQLPYFASGGLAGIALIIAGAGCLSASRSARVEARLVELLTVATEPVVRAAGRPIRPHPSRPPMQPRRRPARCTDPVVIAGRHDVPRGGLPPSRR